MSVFSLQLRSQKVWQSSETIRIRKKNKKQRPGVSDDRGGDKREKSFVVTAGLNGIFARCSSAAQAAEKNKGSFDIGLMFPCFSFQLKKRVCGRKVCRPVYQVVSAVCGATSDPTIGASQSVPSWFFFRSAKRWDRMDELWTNQQQLRTHKQTKNSSTLSPLKKWKQTSVCCYTACLCFLQLCLCFAWWNAEQMCDRRINWRQTGLNWMANERNLKAVKLCGDVLS